METRSLRGYALNDTPREANWYALYCARPARDTMSIEAGKVEVYVSSFGSELCFLKGICVYRNAAECVPFVISQISLQILVREVEINSWPVKSYTVK